jgi:hypothetical protein
MLRERIRQDPAARYYKAAVLKAGQLLDPKSSVSAVKAQLAARTTPEGNALAAFALTLQDAAFVGLVDPSRRDLIGAAADMLHAVVTGITPSAQEFKRIDIARLVMQAGLAYDYLYPALDTGARVEARRWLAESLTLMAATLANADFGFSPTGRRNYNWTPFIVGAFGVGALSIEGESGYDPAWYRQAAAAMRDFLDRGIHASGSPWEVTIMYLAYGFSQGAYFLDAMGRRGEPVWRHPHLLNLSLWWTYDMMPWGEQFNTLSDTPSTNMGLDEIYFRLALADPSALMRWVYRNVAEAPNSGPYAQSSGALWAMPLDSKVQNVDVAQLRLPLTGVFPESSLVYMRSGWGPQDVYLEFQSANEYVGGHAHADRNSFTFMALGRMWAIDSGYHIALGTDHNIVQIDGKSEGFFPQQGRIIQQVEAPGGWASTSIGDAKIAYDWAALGSGPRSRMIQGLMSVPFNPVNYAYRSVTLVRGNHPYILITDAIAKNDEQKHRYTWQMMTPVGNAVEDAGNGRLTIKPAGSGETFLRSRSGSRQPLTASFKVLTRGNYRFYLLMGHDYRAAWNSSVTLSVNQATPIRTLMDAGESSQSHWQPVQVNGRPLVQSLQAGTAHVLRVSADTDQLDIGALLVTPESYDPTAIRSIHESHEPPPESVHIRFSASSPPEGWEIVPADPHEPQLLVQLISPSGAVRADADLYLRHDSKDVAMANAPALRVTAAIDSAQDPQFRVILYPHPADEQLPRITADPLTLSWADGTVDTWAFGRGALSPGLANVTFQLQRRSPQGVVQDLTTSPQP